MNYDKAMKYIHATLRFGSRPGIKRVKDLLSYMGDPQKDLKFVHIAGTNGKGSTTVMCADALTEAGYKTGMYISPYVEDFRERIQIDGMMISREDLSDEVERLIPFVDKMVEDGLEPPTEFELITALAFDYFKREECDIVVLEVGLGGRYDATNVIDTPLVAALTSISIDHAQYLGDTHEKIAEEKCGIIKPGCTVVTCPNQHPDALRVIEKSCKETGSELIVPVFPDKKAIADLFCFSRFIYDGSEWKVALPGVHQIQNAITAIEVLRALRGKGFEVEDRTIKDALAHAKHKGRLEIVYDSPLCIIDGAHNRDGVDMLLKYLDTHFKGRRIIAVTGMLRDKEYEYCLKEIAKRCCVVIATTPDNPRALDADAAVQVMAGECKTVLSKPLIEDAVEEAVKIAGEDDIIIGCGSLHLVGRVKKAILKCFKKNRAVLRQNI